MHKEDYLTVLETVKTLPFNVGKKLLAAILRGDQHKSIEKNNLETHSSYASMAYGKSELRGLIDACRHKDLIEYKKMSYGGSALVLTRKGKKELKRPTHPIYVPPIPQTNTELTKKEEALIQHIPFLQKYNKEQQKAIITQHHKALCVAGAGTGKTTVLIARITFLVSCKGINPKDILAITFTRKAKQELQTRLQKQNIHGVNTYTFNGFAQNQLRKKLPQNPVTLADYGEKARLLQQSLHENGHTLETATSIYFSKTKDLRKQRQKLLQDVLSLLTFCKMRNIELKDLKSQGERESLLLNTGKEFNSLCKQRNKRLFVDQLLDIQKHYEQNPSDIPNYKHILVDEYQDVNNIQVQLLKTLEAEKTFYVGDPRQSIYGWRGSNITYITELPEQEDIEVIVLKKNYRSDKQIVKTGNKCIEPLLLPDLEANSNKKGEINVKGYSSKDEEAKNVVKQLPQKGTVLILARKNSDLNTVEDELQRQDKKYTRREENTQKQKRITLCTIHAAKGLEADTVFIVQATHNNHPLQVSEHPIIEKLQPKKYDKEEEERRLFYVAITRAKHTLHITYTGIPSNYIPYQTKTKKQVTGETLKETLESWRKHKSKTMKLPEFQVLPNNTLAKVAKKKPVSKQQLKGIWGLTPKKIEKYGNEILELVKKST